MIKIKRNKVRSQIRIVSRARTHTRVPSVCFLSVHSTRDVTLFPNAFVPSHVSHISPFVHSQIAKREDEIVGFLFVFILYR